MNNEQLIRFIQGRKEELTKLEGVFNYFEFLKSEGVITINGFDKLKIPLNNRFYFLSRSISDHEKLLSDK